MTRSRWCILGAAILNLLMADATASATPAPPIELRPVVKCSKGLQPLPVPDKECLSKDVLVGDLDIAGAGRQYPRNDTGDLQITLMDVGTARFTDYERDHVGGRFAILIGGKVIATFEIGDPAYKRPTIIPGLRPIIVPGLITVPGLALGDVKTLSEQFKAETALEWCNRHTTSTDRYTQGFCSGYKSQADLTAPSPVINADTLRTAKQLEGDALKFDCAFPRRYGPGPVSSLPIEKQHEIMQMACDGLIGPGPDNLIAPPNARNVKLALRAAFRPAFRFPASEIHIAISSESDGTYLLAQQNGKNWETRTGNLTRTDIGRILSALENAHFWQQPFNHQDGALDGEPVLIEAAFDNWRSTATQNGNAGVDLDTLEQQLLAIAKAHNIGKPLTWFQ